MRKYWIVLGALVLFFFVSSVVIRNLADTIDEQEAALDRLEQQNRTLQDERTTIWAERDLCYEQLRPCLRRCR